MDDVPSRPVDESRSEQEATERDFYDLATEYGVLYRVIAQAVRDAVGKRCTQEDFQLVLTKVSIAGWNKWSADPGCFGPGSLRIWALRRAHWRLADLRAERREDALAKLALQREHQSLNFEVKMPDKVLEDEEERPRAFSGALAKLEPVSRWAVIEVFLHGLTHREAARELGVSKATIDRKLEKAYPILATELADWNPRGSHAPSDTPPTTPPRRRS